MFADLGGGGGAWQERGMVFLRGAETSMHTMRLVILLSLVASLKNL